MTPPLLELRQITKRHGPVRALRGVDLVASDGECIALLGANGAGKSTLLRIVAGLARPSSGSVLLAGEPAEAAGSAGRARIGHVSHHLMLHDALTTRENLRLAARLHGLAGSLSRTDQLLRSLGLLERADEPVRQLSRGLAQRAAVARALLHDPQVLLLDEPFTGLDRASSSALLALLSALRRKGRLLFLVTHDMAQAAELATRVVHLRQGRVTLDEPAAGVDAGSLHLLLEREQGAALSLARQVMAIVAKDALIEWRTRDLVATMGAMGLASVVLFAFAVDFTQESFARLGPPVLWLAFTFTGMTGLARSFAVERENRCLEALLLAPVDRSVVYLGKLVANFLVLLALDAVLLALCFLMLDVGPGAVHLDAARWGWLCVVVALNALGFAAAGTLLAFMASRTRRGDFLLPVLQGVLALPVLISAVVATQRIFDVERPLADLSAPLRLTGVFDVAFIAVSLIVFDHVVED